MLTAPASQFSTFRLKKASTLVSTTYYSRRDRNLENCCCGKLTLTAGVKYGSIATVRLDGLCVLNPYSWCTCVTLHHWVNEADMRPATFVFRGKLFDLWTSNVHNRTDYNVLCGVCSSPLGARRVFLHLLRSAVMIRAHTKHILKIICSCRSL